jgi:dCTP deaminase
VQPASLDLRLGETAYRIRCSFLPGRDTVERRVKGKHFRRPAPVSREAEIEEGRRGASLTADGQLDLLDLQE